MCDYIIMGDIRFYNDSINFFKVANPNEYKALSIAISLANQKIETSMNDKKMGEIKLLREQQEMLLNKQIALQNLTRLSEFTPAQNGLFSSVLEPAVLTGELTNTTIRNTLNLPANEGVVDTIAEKAGGEVDGADETKSQVKEVEDPPFPLGYTEKQIEDIVETVSELNKSDLKQFKESLDGYMKTLRGYYGGDV